MRHIKAVLCAAGLLVFGASSVFAQPPDAPASGMGRPMEMPLEAPEPIQTPTDAIYSFVFWLNAMNLRKGAAFVDGAQFNDALAKMEQEARKEAGQISIMIDEPRLEMIGDAGAEAPGRQGFEILGDDKLRANVRTTVVTLRGNQVHRSTTIDWLQLRRVNNSWKLVPDDPNAPPRRPGENALQEFVNFIAFPVQARSNARESSCLSNMKQLGLGMMQLVQDFDEKFDIKKMQELQRANNQFAKWPIWAQAVFPYVKNTSIFRCPTDPEKGEGVSSYCFNENLDGVSLAQIARPSEVVLLYEGKDGKLEFRHDGRATIGFADGHVKLVGEEESKNLLWKP